MEKKGNALIVRQKEPVHRVAFKPLQSEGKNFPVQSAIAIQQVLPALFFTAVTMDVFNAHN